MPWGIDELSLGMLRQLPASHRNVDGMPACRTLLRWQPRAGPHTAGMLSDIIFHIHIMHADPWWRLT